MKTFFEIFNDFSLNDDLPLEDEFEGELNIYSLDDLIDQFIDDIPYSLEYYLDLVPEEEFEEQTGDESYASEDEEANQNEP